MVAAAVLGAGAISAGASIYGSSSAASAQEAASEAATKAQLQMFQEQQADLAPYMKEGENANTLLNGELPSLTAPVSMTESQLQQTPGYQFNLTQGLKATQSGAAARGLGISGAAAKGAASYATGLADSTYQNQFSNAITSKQTTYNMLAGQQALGENAAAGAGSGAITTGNSIANNITGAGNAAAAADVASGNAIGSAANSASQGYLLNNLIGGSGSSYYGGVNYGNPDTASAASAGVASGLSFDPVTGDVG